MIIRDARPGDAAVLAALAGELGYPSNADAIEARLVTADSESGRVVMVAEDAGGYAEDAGGYAADATQIVGWIDVIDRATLYGGRNAEIQGLIVGEGHRGSGIGEALVAAAERWAAGRDLEVMRVRSRRDRDGAHGFYAELGFTEAKVQTVFEKRLER